MSIDDIKVSIAKLSPEEQDDIRQYIDILKEQNKEKNSFSDEVWDEIENRDRAIRSGEMSSRPVRVVLKEKLDVLSKDLSC